jgi:hypothetical protein
VRYFCGRQCRGCPTRSASSHAKLAVRGNQLEPALALIMPMSVPEWSREEAPPTKTEVHKSKAKPRAGAKEPAPEPGDAA